MFKLVDGSQLHL